MDERADDELAAIAARWQAAPPGDAPDPRAADAARGDVIALLDEIARLRLQLDALTPPPKKEMGAVAVCCDRLRGYLADPDNVVDYWAELDQFLLPVRGGTRSGIGIAFCPWCGSPLPVPERDGEDPDKGGWRI
jgi:hypothetical protein